MRIYTLTQRGARLAASPRGGHDPRWEALYYLRRTGNASDDQLRERGVAPTDILALKRGGRSGKPLIAEVGGE